MRDHDSSRIVGHTETIAVNEKLSYKPATRYRVVGDRPLLEFRESGYEMEGKVLVGGKKRRAFTGSILVVKKDDEGKDRRYLIVPGQSSSRIHIIDTADERAHGTVRLASAAPARRCAARAAATVRRCAGP